MLRAPIKKSFVSYGLTFSTLTLVIRAYGFAEVLGIGEVEGDIGSVESLSQICEFPFKDVENNPEVTGNGD